MSVQAANNLKETATPNSATARSAGPALNAFLWFLQCLLAVAFFMSGIMKAFTPIAELAVNVPWAADLPVALVRFIGASELLGAIGLVAPALTRIRPVLTAWAASGLALVMACAMVFHLIRGEHAGAVITFSLGLMAGSTAWGRFRKAPIVPRAPRD